MRSIRKGQAALAAAVTVVGLASTGVALAAGHSAGDTRGVIDMTSTSDGSYSVLDLGKPGHGDQFSDIKTLSLDYAAIRVGCFGGSPRFTVQLQDPANHDDSTFLTAYVGTPPSFTCAPGDGWTSSGNYADASSGNRWAVGNSGSYVDYADPSIQAYAGWKVTDVDLIVDSGWGSGGTEDIAVNNVTLNDHVATADVHVK